MIRALTLEDFTRLTTTPPEAVPAPQETPTGPDAGDETMAAFDEGYRIGWEDCAKA